MPPQRVAGFIADSVSASDTATAFQVGPRPWHAACAPGAVAFDGKKMYKLPNESRYCGEALADGVVVGDGICEDDTDGDAANDGDHVSDDVCVAVGDGDEVRVRVGDGDEVSEADKDGDAAGEDEADCDGVELGETEADGELDASAWQHTGCKKGVATTKKTVAGSVVRARKG